MNTPYEDSLQPYAELLLRTGVNLQPGQSLIIRAELAYAPIVRLLVAEAYKLHAAHVYIDWVDSLVQRAFLQNADLAAWDVPAYDVTRHRQMVDERWARLALVGPEFPFAFDDVNPQQTRTWSVKRARAIKFYTEAMMANQMQWCVAAVPTVAWAQRVHPELDAEAAVAALWQDILQFVRADQPDPVAAWGDVNRTLKAAAAYLQAEQVRAVHLFDPTPGPDGKPSTDLTIGLTDRPLWVGGSAMTPAGVVFQPNMPTEEIFCTPHKGRAEGYVRTSRPSYPMQREVDGAWFRFEGGEVVEFHAATGEDVLAQFFAIDGAKRLGEIALVDSRSPIFQSGRVFYEILFDENAACHFAFGEAYPECVEGGGKMSREELAALGVNHAETHVDFMVGTATMDVTGIAPDGRRVPIMRAGRFADAVRSRHNG
jgi:aminopeptidase